MVFSSGALSGALLETRQMAVFISVSMLAKSKCGIILIIQFYCVDIIAIQSNIMWSDEWQKV